MAGKHNKEENKGISLELWKVMLVFIILIIGLVLLYQNQIIEEITILNASKENSTEVDYSEYEDIGENAYVSNVTVSKTLTGSGTFDTETTTDSKSGDGSVTWTAGDDISETDRVVRSFDQITWTVSSILALESTTLVENYKGGVICVEASVPSSLSGLVEWDLDSMAWAENATVSTDGTTLTAYYTMTDTDITIPGEQSLVFVLQVYGAGNGAEIVPSFTMSLYGNDEADKKSTTGDTIYVSAAPNYNIQLVRNTNLAKKLTVDYGEGDTSRKNVWIWTNITII